MCDVMGLNLTRENWLVCYHQNFKLSNIKIALYLPQKLGYKTIQFSFILQGDKHELMPAGCGCRLGQIWPFLQENQHHTKMMRKTDLMVYEL